MNKIEEPLEILAENKKQEIIEAYSKKYGIDKWLLSQTWDFLKSADEKEIKRLKRGDIKKGTKLPKRPQFKDGSIIKNGEVLSLEEYEQIKKEDAEKAMQEYLEKTELGKHGEHLDIMEKISEITQD